MNARWQIAGNVQRYGPSLRKTLVESLPLRRHVIEAHYRLSDGQRLGAQPCSDYHSLPSSGLPRRLDARFCVPFEGGKENYWRWRNAV